MQSYLQTNSFMSWLSAAYWPIPSLYKTGSPYCCSKFKMVFSISPPTIFNKIDFNI
uniref:Uncharacterized protein n=1 Tax=viral metagenome TaxID=1070528 RepID=A0A6C0HRM6_9ZZZZ